MDNQKKQIATTEKFFRVIIMLINHNAELTKCILASEVGTTACQKTFDRFNEVQKKILAILDEPTSDAPDFSRMSVGDAKKLNEAAEQVCGKGGK